MIHRLSKKEKLCSRKKIEQLFAESNSFVQYPLRIVYRIGDKNTPQELPQFFISVPKRNFKRAVKRVWIRRRIREAYRLHKHLLPTLETHTLDIAFLYIAKDKKEFATIENSMIEILNKLSNIIKQQ